MDHQFIIKFDYSNSPKNDLVQVSYILFYPQIILHLTTLWDKKTLDDY